MLQKSRILISIKSSLNFHGIPKTLFRDSIQLNMLYEQAKQAILMGTHPVAMDIARQLAAFMIQMQYGDHNEEKHKPGTIKFVFK